MPAYRNVALSPDTYFKVQVWADARDTTLGEAVDFAFDNLGVPPEDVDEATQLEDKVANERSK